MNDLQVILEVEENFGYGRMRHCMWLVLLLLIFYVSKCVTPNLRFRHEPQATMMGFLCPFWLKNSKPYVRIYHRFIPLMRPYLIQVSLAMFLGKGHLGAGRCVCISSAILKGPGKCGEGESVAFVVWQLDLAHFKVSLKQQDLCGCPKGICQIPQSCWKWLITRIS